MAILLWLLRPLEVTLDSVLLDGTRLSSHTIDDAELEALCAREDRVGEIYRTARALMDGAAGEALFRLIGVGLSDLVPESAADLSGDLLDPGAVRRGEAERASDEIRRRFGDGAILKGRALR